MAEDEAMKGQTKQPKGTIPANLMQEQTNRRRKIARRGKRENDRHREG